MKRNDELIIAALISTTSVKDAASKAGVSIKSIYNRLKDDEFRKAYRDARSQLIAKATYALQASTLSAIEVLNEIKDDVNNAPQVRVNAATAVLSNNIKLTEQYEILARLEKLEEWQSERGKHERY